MIPKRLAYCAVLCLMAACAAEQAVQHVALPTAQSVWVGVRASAEASSAAQAGQLDAFAEALEDDDRTAMVLLWPQIKTWALDGISQQQQDGTISPGLAESRIEGVTQFDELVRAIGGAQ